MRPGSVVLLRHRAEASTKLKNQGARCCNMGTVHSHSMECHHLFLVIPPVWFLFPNTQNIALPLLFIQTVSQQKSSISIACLNMFK